MPNYVLYKSHSMEWRANLRRHALTYAEILICLLAIVPAAQAQENELVPPERVLWGFIAFIVVLIWILFICLRPQRVSRKKCYQAHRKRTLPKWLERILLFDLRGAHLPPNASRQVRRAFERRRK